MSTFSGFDAIAATEQLCQRDPDAAAIRAALLALEIEGQQAGWDHPRLANPHLFVLYLDRDHHQVHTLPDPAHNKALNHALKLANGAAGRALLAIGQFAERMTTELAQASDDTIDEVAQRLNIPPDAAATVRAGLLAGKDMAGVEDEHYRFHGYALRYEAWGLTPATPQDEQYGRERRLDQHPDRVEMRQVYLFDRDSSTWVVTRTRGNQPTTAMRAAGNKNQGFAGGIPRGLALLVNSVVPEDVEVPASKINPLLRQVQDQQG